MQTYKIKQTVVIKRKHISKFIAMPAQNKQDNNNNNNNNNNNTPVMKLIDSMLQEKKEEDDSQVLGTAWMEQYKDSKNM